MIGKLIAPLFSLLPQHAISRVIHALARWRWKPWKNLFIRVFTRIFNVNLSEAAVSDPEHYESFNAFFTRSLAAGARPIDEGEHAILSPVDGHVSQAGPITAGRLIQAKGRDYSITELLGGDADIAEPFREGQFATLYLSPRDYHRIHMPVTGTLERMLHIPGRLFGVSRPLVAHVPQLFARNERVAALFDTPCGPMGLVLVGAIGVGSIETVWSGEVTPPRGHRIRSWDYRQAPIDLKAGDEMGRFNMGSTVIVLFADANVQWDSLLAPDYPVQMGRTIGSAPRPTRLDPNQMPGQD